MRIKQSCRQAITTKYLGATDHHGERILVKAQAGRMVVSWDHGLDVEDNHSRAAELFIAKWEWPGLWVAGALPDGTGYCFVVAHAEAK